MRAHIIYWTIAVIWYTSWFKKDSNYCTIDALAWKRKFMILVALLIALIGKRPAEQERVCACTRVVDTN